MQNGHGRESSRCVELGFSKENCSVQLSGGADVIVLDPIKSAASIVTIHVTKMAVTPLDPPWPKPPVVRKLHGFVLHTSEVIAD